MQPVNGVDQAHDAATISSPPMEHSEDLPQLPEDLTIKLKRIRNYANINRSTENRTPAGFAAMARRAIEAGFDAVKLAPFDDMSRKLSDTARLEEFTKLGIDRARAVREAIGPKRDLLVDVHSHFDRQHGLELIRPCSR